MAKTWTKRMLAASGGVTLGVAILLTTAMWIEHRQEAEWAGWWRGGRPQHVWTGDPEEIEFLEAVLRYQFAHNTTNESAVAEASRVLVGVVGPEGEQDPPPGLLERLQGIRAIEPASALEPDFEFGVPAAVEFVVRNLQWIDDTTAEAYVEYRGGCHSGHVYRFERREGTWVMVSGGMIWIT